MSSNGRVLCVDDEPNVLEGLKRTLRRSFDVTTAAGPGAALEVLAKEEPFAAIVSDLSMPGMDGISFFEEARKICPSSLRILLTGNADVTTAMQAVNRGSVFRFLLKPCAPDVLQQAIADAVKQYELVAADRAMLERIRMGPGAGTGAPPAVMQFLVVDASPTMRRILVNSLDRIGYSEVVAARDGVEALELFGPWVRCVITDWDMPGMDGLQLVKALRVRPDAEHVPILMATTRSHRSDILAAKNAGVSNYLVKPFTPAALKEKLDAVLRPTQSIAPHLALGS